MSSDVIGPPPGGGYREWSPCPQRGPGAWAGVGPDGRPVLARPPGRDGTAVDPAARTGLRDRHLVAVLDVLGPTAERWLVTEHVEAETLAARLRRTGPLPVAEVAAIGRSLASGLAAAHRQGCTWGVVTTSSVLLGADGVARLDVLGGDADHDEPPATRAVPELAAGGPATPASDVFLLGSVLYTAVEGVEPFPEPADRTAAVRLRAPERAGALVGALHQLHQHDPARRPGAAEAAALLARIADAAATGTTGRPGPTVPGWTPPPPAVPVRGTSPGSGRRWVATVLVTAAVVGAAALAAFALFVAVRPDADPPGPAAAPLSLADQKEVDLCAFVTGPSVTRFGEVSEPLDFGAFFSCSVDVEAPGTPAPQVRVLTAFLSPSAVASSGALEPFGEVGLTRYTGDASACARIARLPGGHGVVVSARQIDGTPAGPDLCAVADAALGDVLATVLGEGHPTRPTPPTSPLTGLDACAVVDDATLGAVPGLDSTVPNPRWGRWGCTWGDIPDERSALEIIFTRTFTSAFTPTGTIGTRDIRSTPVEGGCTVDVAGRRFTGARGSEYVELVSVYVSAAGAAGTPPCPTAVAVATKVAESLP